MNPVFQSPLARGAAIAILACLLAVPGQSVRAQSGPPTTASERSVKAAYVYRFLPYVEWPSKVLPPGAPLVVGVLGADDVADELEQIVRKRGTAERAVHVRRLDVGESWLGVHALYFEREGARRVYQVLAALHERSVLTISNADDAVQRGVIIGLVQVDSRLRFEVNAEAAERAHLKLSSRLLTVAMNVRPAVR